MSSSNPINEKLIKAYGPHKLSETEVALYLSVKEAGDSLVKLSSFWKDVTISQKATCCKINLQKFVTKVI